MSSGQASLTRRRVSRSPIRVTSSSSRHVTRVTDCASLSWSIPLIEPVGPTVIATNVSCSTRASVRARRKRAAKPSAPANRDKAIRSLSQTCAGLWLAFIDPVGECFAESDMACARSVMEVYLRLTAPPRFRIAPRFFISVGSIHRTQAKRRAIEQTAPKEESREGC